MHPSDISMERVKSKLLFDMNHSSFLIIKKLTLYSRDSNIHIVPWHDFVGGVNRLGCKVHVHKLFKKWIFFKLTDKVPFHTNYIIIYVKKIAQICIYFASN